MLGDGMSLHAAQAWIMFVLSHLVDRQQFFRLAPTLSFMTLAAADGLHIELAAQREVAEMLRGQYTEFDFQVGSDTVLLPVSDDEAVSRGNSPDTNDIVAVTDPFEVPPDAQPR